jgi:hypothetical protein
MSKEEVKKKTDEQVMFPEGKVTINNKEYEITPWCLGDLIKVNPILEVVFEKLEKKGTKLDVNNFNFSIIKDIYFASVPQMSKLIEFTLGISEEEVNKLSIQDALGVVITVFVINMESFKSFFSLFFPPENQEGPEEEVKGQD